MGKFNDAAYTPVSVLASTDLVMAQSSDGLTDKPIAKSDLASTIFAELSAVPFLAADETKLDGIEALADVTDATNVEAAGAVMDGDFTASDGFMHKTGAGTYAAAKYNLNAAVNPAVTDDNTLGYQPGSIWVNTTFNPDLYWLCLDASTGAAVWIQIMTNNFSGSNQWYIASISANNHQGHFIDQWELCGRLSGSPQAFGIGMLTEKVTPVATDMLMLRDSVDGSLKKVDIDNLPTGTGVDATVWDAQSVVVAVTDNTPIAQVLAEDQVLGRLTGGNIGALTAANLRQILYGSLERTAITLTTHTFAQSTKHTMHYTSNASAITATLPDDVADDFPDNDLIIGIQGAAGAITFAAGGSATVTPVAGLQLVTNGIGALWWAFKRAANDWLVGGDLKQDDASAQFQVDIPISDAEGTAITVGANKGPVWIPRFDVDIIDVFGHLKNAGSGTGNNVFDIHIGASTIMTTDKINIEPGETDSEDAVTQPALTTTSAVAGSVFSAHVDAVHSVAAGDGGMVSMLLRKS